MIIALESSVVVCARNRARALISPYLPKAQFTIRHVAMELYYAAADYFSLFHRYTDDVTAIAPWAPEDVLLGNCTRTPDIRVSVDGQHYTAWVFNTAMTRMAVIRDDRYLIVRSVLVRNS